MGTHNSGRPKPARRLVLRKIARPAALPAKAPPPSAAQGAQTAVTQLPELRALVSPAGGSVGPVLPPSAVPQEAPSFAQVAPNRALYKSAIAPPPPAHWQAELPPANASLPPVVATVPPEPITPAPPSTERRPARLPVTGLVAVAGLALLLGVASFKMAERTSRSTSSILAPVPPQDRAAAHSPVAPAASSSISPEDRLPTPSGVAAQHTAAVDLMPEAPVEALPKAPMATKPAWAARRLDPVATATPHPRIDHTITSAAGRASGDQGAVQGATPDESEDSKAAPEFPPSVPQPVDPLLKAVHDDIEEEEAAHRK